MRFAAVLSVLIMTGSFSAPAAAQKAAQKATPAAVKTSGAGPRTVELIATDDMTYSLSTITARPGEQLRIRLTSRGVIPKVAMAHNVVILKMGTDALKFVNEGAPHRATDFIAPALQSAVIAKTPFAGPGETVHVVFTVPARVGKYPFICTFAGHYQAGAKGTLVVR